MLLIRRFPSLVYRHKCIFLATAIFLILSTYFLYTLGVICSNSKPWEHLNRLCYDVNQSTAAGDLCPKICSKDAVVSISCQAFHAGKDIVFSALLNDGLILMMKSSQSPEPQDVFHWTDRQGEHYPSENTFRELISHRIKIRLNVSLTFEEVEKLTRYPSSKRPADDKFHRHLEMREVWRLLQDNEYLLSSVYASREIFPKILATCGGYIGVEYVNPILDGEMTKVIGESESRDWWLRRVRLAMLLLDLVDQIDAQGLLLCDVKPSHFGMSKLAKVKILDLDVTFPRHVVDAITNSKRSCLLDSDCHFFDCRSQCNRTTNICDSPVITTNRQIVCEKILLGWTLPGLVMIPGLLMSSTTPPTLASLLRQCAAGSDTSDRLYHLLEGISAGPPVLD